MKRCGGGRADVRILLLSILAPGGTTAPLGWVAIGLAANFQAGVDCEELSVIKCQGDESQRYGVCKV